MSNLNKYKRDIKSYHKHGGKSFAKKVYVKYRAEGGTMAYKDIIKTKPKDR